MNKKKREEIDQGGFDAIGEYKKMMEEGNENVAAMYLAVDTEENLLSGMATGRSDKIGEMLFAFMNQNEDMARIITQTVHYFHQSKVMEKSEKDQLGPIVSHIKTEA